MSGEVEGAAQVNYFASCSGKNDGDVVIPSIITEHPPDPGKASACG